ncbi:TetR/AcrR family transcriptional regulator [Herbiconiux sp. L3-i23]|uniref:TetR/AcrR family transcriptional regulator n=1 Tax=Herbiconiux sp. L3-i23 TaxID=2905871 RepID=UPI002067D894|nr:TetR/AcrR family transcriptional regulator [Herbiconiux sp. L3-i23]BDI23173.1 hypothetical protein L3i23_19490 [Herbiconiux sp. L3-i23]
MPGESTAGRPRRSSRSTLQDAAYELFLERGYAAVPIDEIARTAGVSRSTFWGYAASKSDLLWFDVDAALDRLERRLAALAAERVEHTDHDDRAVGIREAVREVAASFGPGEMPLPFVEAGTMGVVDELRASAFPRLARLVDLLGAAWAPASPDGATARADAWRLAAEITAAAETWLTDRPRGSLVDHIRL